MVVQWELLMRLLMTAYIIVAGIGNILVAGMKRVLIVDAVKQLVDYQLCY